MGPLKKFEQRLEGLVNGAFAKAFKSDVQPVEIASALKRECDNNATIWNRDRTMVPNDFVVELGQHDYERLSPYVQQLGGELATVVRDYAQQQRYSFIGPVEVHFEHADDLDTGLYRVRSQALAGSQSHHEQPQPPQPPFPGGGRNRRSRHRVMDTVLPAGNPRPGCPGHHPSARRGPRECRRLPGSSRGSSRLPTARIRRRHHGCVPGWRSTGCVTSSPPRS